MKCVKHRQKRPRFSSKWTIPLLSPNVNVQHPRNQEDIVGGVVKVLHNLIGWDWGQYGEAAFFVQGAYRDAENDLKTFK
jgi:hypothetical protein